MQTSQNSIPSDRQISHLEHWKLQLKIWTSSPAFGYICSILLIGFLLLLEKLDDYIPQAPLFTSAPFALVAIFTALVWGIGPALVAFVLGVIALVFFVTPSPLTISLLSDTMVLLPFLLLQLIAIVVIIGLERSRRHLLEAHQQLQRTNQQLSQAVQLKDFIIMRAAHELRTPLTTILGRTQLFSSRLQKSGASATNLTELSNYLKIVELRSHHLQALIESLLHLSDVHVKTINASEQLCDLGQITCGIVENQRILAGRAITCDLPVESAMIAIDEHRLAQVIENLLSNALKYSPENSQISVQISLQQSAATLRIYNECPSLPTEQLARLFDPFYRTTEIEYSSIPGWGLGLAITKEIVERCGGSIQADASDSKGIAFLLTFPRVSDH